MAATDIIPNTGQTFLRHHQRAELEHEKQQLQAQLSNPAVQDKGIVNMELRKRDFQLQKGAPPELSAEQRDVLSKEETELRTRLQDNMLSQEEMRKAPSGAVGRLLQFEKKFKSDILRWKNIRVALEPDNPDPDIANLEIYRPATRPTDPSMHSALITGQTFSFPSEGYKAGYDAIDFTAHGGSPPVSVRDDSEEVEALKARLAEIEQLLAERPDPLTPEQPMDARPEVDPTPTVQRKPATRKKEKGTREITLEPADD